MGSVVTAVMSRASAYNLRSEDGRIVSGEHLAGGSVFERSRYGGGSIMVWRGIITHQKTPLYHAVGNLTGVRYNDEILPLFALPCIQQIGP